MKNIKWVLTERYYAWEGARKLAQIDPEVSVSEQESSLVYEPSEETLDARERERSLKEYDDLAEDEHKPERRVRQPKLIPASVVRRPKDYSEAVS